MNILGSQIAEQIFEKLNPEVEKLKEKNKVPLLAVILVGSNPRSLSYIKQKDLQAQHIGAQSKLYRFDENVSEKKLINTIEQLNNDKTVYGILIQQPLPKHLNARTLVELVKPVKEVDGLSSNSPYEFPLVSATMEIFRYIYNVNARNEMTKESLSNNKFLDWLRSKYIVVIGKGQTGGGPIIRKLHNLECNVHIIDSKTENSEQLTRQTDIIISAVGKRNLIKPEQLKKGVILIGIGIGKDEHGLYGDYDEKEIQNIAAFYTPTPGGVGPVNVACLMQNLINATKKQTN